MAYRVAQTIGVMDEVFPVLSAIISRRKCLELTKSDEKDSFEAMVTMIVSDFVRTLPYFRVHGARTIKDEE